MGCSSSTLKERTLAVSHDGIPTPKVTRSSTDASTGSPLKHNSLPVSLQKSLSVRAAKTSDGSSTGATLVSEASLCSEEEDPEVLELMQLMSRGPLFAQLSDFAKAYVDPVVCRRILRKYNGNLSKSATKLEAALRWRQQHATLLQTLAFRQSSDARVIGFDRDLRPVLYQCARNQLLPNVQCLDQYVVRMVQAIEMMPLGVETMVHFWDMHGMMIRLNYNVAGVLNLLEALEGYFAERLHKLIVVDLPSAARVLKDMVWKFVPARTQQKVLFLSLAEALAYADGTCREDTVARISSAMALNRDPASSFKDRQATWLQVSGPVSEQITATCC